MGLTGALSAGQLTDLRGNYAADQWISLVPNTTIFAARVNQTASSDVVAQVTFDSVTTGAFGDIEIGQTVYISHTNSIAAAHFRGRARKDAAAAILYINETSVDIYDNDYIFVIDDYDIWPKLPREISGTRYNDYDKAFEQLPPVITNIKTAYADWVSGAPSGYIINFKPTAIAATEGASISSYQFTIPDGVVTAGALNTNDVTIRFPFGFRHVKLVVTDDGARTTTLYIRVWAHDTTNYMPETGFTGASVDGNTDTGWSATVNAFDGVSAVYDHAFACVWSTEYHWPSGEASTSYQNSVIDNVDFVGRLRTETAKLAADEIYSITSETAFRIDGPGQQLARLTGPLIFILNDATPTVWDEIDTLTSWRALVYVLAEFSTFFLSHSLALDDVGDPDDNTYRELAINPKEPNLWGTIQKISEGTTATFEFAPYGNARYSRDARYLTSAQRASLSTVANWELQDAIDWSFEHAHAQTVGKANAAGGWLNTTTLAVTPYLAIAPGGAQGDAEGKGQLNNQLLAADAGVTNGRAELRVRVGHHLAALNPTDEASVVLPSAYHCLIPTLSERHTWTIPASTAPGQKRDYSTTDYWQLVNISHSHDNATGVRSASATFKLETSGDPGQDFIPPDPGEWPTVRPLIPAITPYPNFPEFPWWLPPDPDPVEFPPYLEDPTMPVITDGPPPNGNTVLLFGKEIATPNNSELWITTTFLGIPTWREITPASGEVRHVVWKNPIFAAGNPGAYCLMYDSGADESTVYRTTNAIAQPIAWTTGAAAAGKFDRVLVAEDGIYITGTLVGSGIDETLNVDSANGNWHQMTNTTVNGEAYDLTLSATAVYGPGLLCDSFYRSNDAWSTHTPLGPWPTDGCLVSDNAPAPSPHPAYQGAHTYSVQLAGNNTQWRWQFSDSAYGDNVGIHTINIKSATNSANTRYSTDEGATWAVAETLGTSPGAEQIGTDVIKVGAPIIGSAYLQTKIAAVAGGAYSSEANHPAGANPACIAVPFRQIGSATKNIDVAAPHYIIGSTVLASGGNLWTVAGAAGVDITAAATHFPFNPNGIAVNYYSSDDIAILGSTGTEIKLHTTVDGGSNWSDRGVMGANTVYLRMRTGDSEAQQLFIADGTNGIGYSQNAGDDIFYRTYPGSGVVRGIEPYG